MLARADGKKGRVDIGTMKNGMPTPIKEGGTYHSLIRYQQVVTPSGMVMDIRLSCGEGLVESGLKTF